MVILIACAGALGCGGSNHHPPGTAVPPGGIRSLAVACHESETALASDLRSALEDLARHGLHGSRAELVTAVEELLNYRATHGESQPSCPGLLTAFVHTLERRPLPKASPPPEPGPPGTEH